MKGSICKTPSGYIVKYPTGQKYKRIQIRRRTLEEAERLLTALRYHDDEGTLDIRDWNGGASLAFDTLAKQWLDHVHTAARKEKTWLTYSRFMTKAIDAWGNRGIRTIKRADIAALIESYQAGAKSKANMTSCLSTFWRWAVDKEHIRPSDVPVFPKIKYRLGLRKTVDKETQARILDEVWNQVGTTEPKAWLGIKWLATYVCLRPSDLCRVLEEDIDRKARKVRIRDPKAAEPYDLPLTTQDAKIILQSAPGAPSSPFFRHSGRTGGAAIDTPFGESYLYRVWKRACAALGIEGVDLYGGTRHSSARAMRHTHSPEQIKWATMHRTSASFERYFRMDENDLRGMYEEATPCTTLVPPIPGALKG